MNILFLLLALALCAMAVMLWRDPFWIIRTEFHRLRRAAGLKQAEVHVAGHRWVYAYRAAKDAHAPVLVMLHGFTGSKENWYPLVKALGERYRVLVPDLPGWGESERKPDAVYGFVEQAQHVAAFIEALSPERPVILLGHSMGGGIATLVTARYPQLVAKVVLLNAAGVRFNDNAFSLAVLAGENPFAVHNRASLQRYVDTVFYSEHAKPWIPWLAAYALIRKRRADAAFEQTVLDHIGRGADSLLPGEEANNIQQPTLLIWGQQDAAIDPSAMALYAQRIAQAQTLMLEQCGHMSLVEYPREVAEAVVKFCP